MKTFLPALRILIFFTLLTGLIYPLAVTGLSNLFMFDKSAGQLITKNGELKGSRLIGQNFEKNEYFWPRPSATSYNPQPSGGSNAGPTNADLKKAVAERREKLMKAHEGRGEPPQDLLFASGSGLDPHMSPAAARYQVLRVAQARGLQQVQVEELVKRYTQPRQFGLFGEATVNVLELNLALDNQRE